jgi:hypothetical protein
MPARFQARIRALVPHVLEDLERGVSHQKICGHYSLTSATVRKIASTAGLPCHEHGGERQITSPDPQGPASRRPLRLSEIDADARKRIAEDALMASARAVAAAHGTTEHAVRSISRSVGVAYDPNTVGPATTEQIEVYIRTGNLVNAADELQIPINKLRQSLFLAGRLRRVGRPRKEEQARV